MIREDIIRMAQDAGGSIDDPSDLLTLNNLERFADLVAAAEREACAKVIENYCGAWDDEGFTLASTIRARGNNDQS